MHGPDEIVRILSLSLGRVKFVAKIQRLEGISKDVHYFTCDLIPFDNESGHAFRYSRRIAAYLNSRIFTKDCTEHT